MTDIAGLLRRAAEYVGPCGDGDLVEEMLAAAEAMGEAVPDECPHMIVFEDTEVGPMLFSGAGAKAAAMKAWENACISWTAHLFVRVAASCKNDTRPNACLAPPPAPAVPEGWRVERVWNYEVPGFIIGTPRADGVRHNTAIFEDSGEVVERLLYAMLAAAGDKQA